MAMKENSRPLTEFWENEYTANSANEYLFFVQENISCIDWPPELGLTTKDIEHCISNLSIIAIGDHSRRSTYTLGRSVIYHEQNRSREIASLVQQTICYPSVTSLCARLMPILAQVSVAEDKALCGYWLVAKGWRSLLEFGELSTLANEAYRHAAPREILGAEIEEYVNMVTIGHEIGHYLSYSTTRGSRSSCPKREEMLADKTGYEIASTYVDRFCRPIGVDFDGEPIFWEGLDKTQEHLSIIWAWMLAYDFVRDSWLSLHGIRGVKQQIREEMFCLRFESLQRCLSSAKQYCEFAYAKWVIKFAQDLVEQLLSYHDIIQGLAEFNFRRKSSSTIRLRYFAMEKAWERQLYRQDINQVDSMLLAPSSCFESRANLVPISPRREKGARVMLAPEWDCKNIKPCK